MSYGSQHPTNSTNTQYKCETTSRFSCISIANMIKVSIVNSSSNYQSTNKHSCTFHLPKKIHSFLLNVLFIWFIYFYHNYFNDSKLHYKYYDLSIWP